MTEAPVDLGAREVSLAYDGRVISEHLDLDVEPGSFSIIIGPNACGKSTLLRALAGLMTPRQGAVVLDGADIATLPARSVARRVGLLPQGATAPEGITVAELVARGRYVHQRMLRSFSARDEAAIARALATTGTADLSTRRVDELSGGQRQRVWIAMVLAQETPLLLLDEPTTYLDITHQIEVLNLLHELHLAGRTVLAVLHDLNQAARYATHIIAMREGRVVAQGPPSTTVTETMVEDVFAMANLVIPDPVTGTPLVIPKDVRRHPTP